MLKRYSADKAHMLFTDTGSVTYHVETDYVYKDMFEIRDHFDTNDYLKNHFLYSPVNAKLLGKIMDECYGRAPLEFVALRSKMSFFTP